MDRQDLNTGDVSARTRKQWRAPTFAMVPTAANTSNNNQPSDDTGNGFGSGNDLGS